MVNGEVINGFGGEKTIIIIINILLFVTKSREKTYSTTENN